ncbi:MAG TPA: beta-N-acetylglucosaminidase domain-containing protein [Candidatus Binatia bacterium]
MRQSPAMRHSQSFRRRGVVEGFFGPVWSMAHRRRLFDFGAARGMNTYLYAPKDDPYHRERWMEPYPQQQWRALLTIIRAAQKRQIDFVYGFHPGKALLFSAEQPLRVLLSKAQRFYDAGVRTFAVLFDDIPSRLEHSADRRRFNHSLARAEGNWLAEIIARQPPAWADVEWWICPSFYTPDPLLARVFGAFEPHFLENLANYLPPHIPCCWTGPSVVAKKITLAHVRKIAQLVGRPLILWDNYPVNDLSMTDELHIGPLQKRDPHLAQAVYAYLNNPLVQEELSLIPLATCFDYAATPMTYNPEESWNEIVTRTFGAGGSAHWRAIRTFCERAQRAKRSKHPVRIRSREAKALQDALNYLNAHRQEKWGAEIKPWAEQMERALSTQQQ